MRFKDIPFHAWNMNTFTHIGNACGGLIELERETRDKFDIIEIMINVRFNYTGFIPSTINIIDSEEIGSLSKPWFIQRDDR